VAGEIRPGRRHLLRQFQRLGCVSRALFAALGVIETESEKIAMLVALTAFLSASLPMKPIRVISVEVHTFLLFCPFVSGKEGRDIYFFANSSTDDVDTFTEVRGKFRPAVVGSPYRRNERGRGGRIREERRPGLHEVRVEPERRDLHICRGRCASLEPGSSETPMEMAVAQVQQTAP